MDWESYLKGYLTGVSLHGHIRKAYKKPQEVASFTARGAAAATGSLWRFNTYKITAITLITADYLGGVSVSYSLDGVNYSGVYPMDQFLKLRAYRLFRDVNPFDPNGYLYFNFQVLGEQSRLYEFVLYGYMKEK